MNRSEFVKRVIQAGLFVLLALVFFVLKNRIVTGEGCSSCPENGSCPGKNECSKLL
jgi:hypothetical protein